MQKLLILWISLVMLVAIPAAASLTYDISAELDPSSHRVLGYQEMRWTNTSNNSTSELYFHLYLNAFASNATTFMRELGGGTLRTPIASDLAWGFIQVDRIENGNGIDLLPSLEYVRPDDGNIDDYTVARVNLDTAIQPGETMVIVMDFTAQLPSIVARSGFLGDFHMVGQWFPKLAVLEDGGWNCHQYHANSEFFADFANFNVNLTVPQGWVVGASGIEVGRTSDEEGKDHVRFSAARVHDFAWSAAPSELMTMVDAEFDPSLHVPDSWLRRAAEELGRTPSELQLPPIYLRFMVPHEQAALVPRMIRAARLSVAWLGLNLGPYPYPQITVVSPPAAALEAWGMEYPTFITTGATRLMASPAFFLSRWVETVTAHELAHQYFQGLLASNEAERGWLDEGLASWAENNVIEAMSEAGLIPERAMASPWAKERAAAAAGSLPVRPERRSWEFRRRFDYFRASYGRPAVALRTLEGLIGRDTVARGLRAYADQHRFTHPDGEDLFSSLEQAAGRPLDWFFDQTIRGDAVVDWAVLSVRNLQSKAEVGLQLENGKWVLPESVGDSEPEAELPWLVKVDVGRRGDLIGPVEIRIRFEDGREHWQRWDGVDRWHQWSITSSSPVVEVAVDPRGVWALEGRRADNYWRSSHSRAQSTGHLWWLQRMVASALQGVMPWG